MSKKKKEEVLTHQTELRKDFQRENKPSAKPIYVSEDEDLTIAIGRAFPVSPLQFVGALGSSVEHHLGLHHARVLKRFMPLRIFSPPGLRSGYPLPGRGAKIA